MEVLKLRTLGGVYVVGANGEPLSGAAGQRRLLALLSVLVVAGDGGLSRDKLVALLWPESDDERGRHSLTQALYAARRALGADDLFSNAGDIRLNRARLTSDVQELEHALGAGELERAAALYQGPFLDGFYLPGSSEFEQWASGQRSRLEDQIVGVLDRLAQQADADGALDAVVDWRKRLAALRPLDSSATARLMTAMARAGDRAGALQQARLHETLLREELGLDPDPAVTALVARLREPASLVDTSATVLAPGATRPSAADGSGADAAPEAATRALAGAPVVALEAPEPEPGRLAPAEVPARLEGAVEPASAGARGAGERRWVAWLAAAVVAVVLGVVALVRGGREGAPVAAAPQLRQKVVVAPFRVAGASESLAYLRDGMVELLSARLADDSAAQSVDAGAVLSAWRAAGLAASVDVPRDTIVRLASRLGAERVVIGSVVGTRNHAVLNARVVSVPSGAVTREATVEGPADSISMLVDQLAAKLLVLDAGEDASLASQTTASLRGLRAFLSGQSAFRSGDDAAALRDYERAVQLDSTFALAALQLVRTADRLQTAESRSASLALAWRFQEALGERDRAILHALAGPRFPAPSSAAEQVAAWERPVSLFPDLADAWYVLGARLFHDGATAALPTARARSAAALRRALVLDAGHAAARKLLALLAAESPGPAAGPMPTERALRDSSGALAPVPRWRVALARGDSAALRRFRDTLPRLGRANLRALAQSSQYDAVALGDARRALRELASRGGRPVERIEVALAQHSLASNEGRRADAVDAIERLAELQPGSHPQLRLRVLDALYGDGSRSTAAAAAGELARRTTGPLPEQPMARAIHAADACVLVQWRLEQGDTADARRTVALLRSVGGRGGARPVAATPPAACAELLDAALAVVAGRRDAGAALARLDSLALTEAVAGDASSYAPLLVARLHGRLGDAPAALTAIRRRSYLVGWPRYLAASLREEGRYAALAGEPEVARRAYGRYLVLRAGADAELVGEAQSVRAALAALPSAPPAALSAGAGARPAP